MRAFIDALEKELKNHILLVGKAEIEAYGSTVMIPDIMPYINIVPQSKVRNRQFFIGDTTKQYDVDPRVRVEVWESSVESLRDAFNKCEALSELVLSALASITATSLGVDHHESQIEEFQDDQWEMSFYYVANILVTAKKQETH